MNCKKCNKHIGDKAEKCPHCGASQEVSKNKKQKKWHERTSVTLSVAAVLIIVGLGFVHIITGIESPYNLPFDIARKKSFGYRETFVNAKKIKAIPYVAAKVKYPIGCEVLQRLNYIESGNVFETAMTEQLKEMMNEWRAEFEESLNKPKQQCLDRLRGKTELSDTNSDSSEINNNRGIDAAVQGQYETAILEFTRACRKNPAFADAYYNRGLIYITIGQLGKAISDFTQTIEITPEFAEAYIHRGDIYVIMNKYDQAISDFTRSIEMEPNRAEVYFRRTLAFFANGQYDNALQDVQKIQSMGLHIPPGFLKNLERVSHIER
jgi:tetratricopeptide (TPR) repeat protein